VSRTIAGLAWVLWSKGKPFGAAPQGKREESPDTTSRMDADRSKDRPLHKRGKPCGLRAAGNPSSLWLSGWRASRLV